MSQSVSVKCPAAPVRGHRTPAAVNSCPQCRADGRTWPGGSGGTDLGGVDIAPPVDSVDEWAEEEANHDTDEIKYSFLADFEEREEQFRADFEGVPNRFFNADLRGKFAGTGLPAAQLAEYLDEIEDGDRLIYADSRGLSLRLMHSLASKDDLAMSSEDAEKMFADLGFEGVEEITDPAVIRGFKGNRAWVAHRPMVDDDGEPIIGIRGEPRMTKVVISDAQQPNLSSYRMRRRTPVIGAGSFVKMDLRGLAGASRMRSRVEGNILDSALRDRGPNANNKVAALRALIALEDAQLEGRSLAAQRKYMKDARGSVATAYMDKKNPDKIRQEMMANTRLRGQGKPFTKVEIDNDVDPDEYADFERSYEEIAHLLPKVPDDRKPILRIRKLGKHKASGLYFPHVNTVALDVRESGSAVHELAHQFDIAVKQNASLDKEFRGFVGEYARDLKLPSGMAASKANYYTTPTEVFARGYELYLNEKLAGKKNRLLNSSKLANFDYAPINDNPELKSQMFKFFDRLN